MATIQVQPLIALSSSSLFSGAICPNVFSCSVSVGKPNGVQLSLVRSHEQTRFVRLYQCRRRALEKEGTGTSVEAEDEEDEEEEGLPLTAEDQESIDDVKRVFTRIPLLIQATANFDTSNTNQVLQLLKKNRDMLFNEVKLTVMIEDLREGERKKLLGIEDPNAPTRDDLVEALEQVNEGKAPRNRVALKVLAEEMKQWPNLEVEAVKKEKRKSLYAKSTDTGVTPREAARRLNMDWDEAAEIEEPAAGDASDVPSVVGYGALYLVSAFPIIIGISVVLILFYNSLQ